MQKTQLLILTILLIIFLSVLSIFYLTEPTKPSLTMRTVSEVISLPSPVLNGNMSVEEAIQNRRSVRQYTSQAINIGNLSQILWAAQGVTDKEKNLRATPSAGQVYPLDIYVMVGSGGVTGLEEGFYHYQPSNNTLEKLINGDLRSKLSEIANNQPWVDQAPVDIVITGNYRKMLYKYPDSELSTRFVNLEAGHAGENIYLQTEALGLLTVSLGSFDKKRMIQLLQLPGNETPIYIFPVGHPVKGS